MWKLIKICLALVLLINVTLANKVKLSLYYEGLCPTSKSFIAEQLYPLINQDDFKSRIELELIPFGKASYIKKNNTYEFTCQHGPDECKTNIYMACTLKLYNVSKALDYSYCIMKEENPIEYIQTCTNSLQLNYEKIDECTKSKDDGQLYLKELGDKTLSLKPTLIFIPWILFNDEYDSNYLYESLVNLKKVVCIKLNDNQSKSCKSY